MVNIVIPMAGAGSRFLEGGFRKPKPFINVNGKAMIERVLENLAIPDSRFVLIARKDHLVSEKSLIDIVKEKFHSIFLAVDNLTEGAACTILLSSWIINSDEPLLTANADQIVDINILDFIEDTDKRKLDGSMITFYSDHPKWSYAKVDDNEFLIELKEKQLISNHATAGLYYFRRGKDFVNSAVEMIGNNDRVNNEFYTAPAYNYAIKAGLKIGIYEIDQSKMFGLGTPEDLELYLQHLYKVKKD